MQRMDSVPSTAFVQVKHPVSLSYPDALDRCLTEIRFCLPDEEIPVIHSLGRILREDVISPHSVPAFPKSVMDGYAVRKKDIAGASPDHPVRLRTTGNIPAGTAPGKKIGEGEAVRIMTGAPVPEGADAVIRIEDTRPSATHVEILKAAENGYILAEGHDVRTGECMLTAGIRISPPDMGLMSACGQSRVRVSQKPRIGILSTGNELAAPGGPAAEGQVFDMNGYTLSGLVFAAGADAELLGIARDRCEDILSVLKQAIHYDILIVSGGFSFGDYDVVRESLARAEVHEILHDVAISRGKTIYFGRRGRQFVFGLPGNPVSALMNFKLFILPAIDKMTGRHETGMKTGMARVLNGRLLKPGGQRFLRGRLDLSSENPGVWILTNQRSGLFHPIASADVLIEVPDDMKFIREGDLVQVLYMNP